MGYAMKKRTKIYEMAKEYTTNGILVLNIIEKVNKYINAQGVESAYKEFKKGNLAPFVRMMEYSHAI